VRGVGAALAFTALAAAAGASATPIASPPAAIAQSWAVRVIARGSAGGTAVVGVPPAVVPSKAGSFAYPADGSVISTGAVSASASTSVDSKAEASASSSVAGVSIFRGQIRIGLVRVGASGATGERRATGSFGGIEVRDVVVLGHAVIHPRMRIRNWGLLRLSTTAVDRRWSGYAGAVTGVDIRLTAAHGGLPAGSEIELGHSQVSVQTAPFMVEKLEEKIHARLDALGPPLGDRPQLLPRVTGPLIGVPQLVTPPLGPIAYVFPVYGPSSVFDVYGSYRADVGFHHGDDLLGSLGQPVVAVADGTVFSVGWNRLGGNRLWLRDHQGNLFYYAALAAFSTATHNGARVRAGQVIGFVGNTGNDDGSETHLHFEVHPVSLLYLGYDGGVDPLSYLHSWKPLQSLPYPVATGWAPSPPGASKMPLPGAMLIGSADIASAGLGIAKRG
jgi:murein DD-endopeptidase MepM/ murein hydrolase activator NlpD